MRTKRVQVLMAPEEYEQLERAAKQQRVSVGDLIRRAVRERYLRAEERRQQAFESLLNTKIESDWGTPEALCEEMDAAYDERSDLSSVA
jgi:hypothetical protein